MRLKKLLKNMVQCVLQIHSCSTGKKLVFHGRIDNAMKPDDTATEKTMIKYEKIIVR